MRSAKRGFTLPELLAVIAILAIMAAILFPVLSSVRATAIRTSCLSNFRNATAATTMYLADYDDRFMPVNYMTSNSRTESMDRTWVQLLLPYIGSFDVFTCPADGRHRASARAIFDIDLIPGDTYARYYRASLLSNIGYNYLYLSPMFAHESRDFVEPRSLSQVKDTMLMFADSRGRDGGSYILVPPCRRYAQGQNRDSFNLLAGAKVYSPTSGWADRFEWDRYGRAWPWHLERANIATVGGAVTNVNMNELAAGCDAQDNWAGLISDSEMYLWDMQ